MTGSVWSGNGTMMYRSLVQYTLSCIAVIGWRVNSAPPVFMEAKIITYEQFLIPYLFTWHGNMDQKRMVTIQENPHGNPCQLMGFISIAHGQVSLDNPFIKSHGTGTRD